MTGDFEHDDPISDENLRLLIESPKAPDATLRIKAAFDSTPEYRKAEPSWAMTKKSEYYYISLDEMRGEDTFTSKPADELCSP